METKDMKLLTGMESYGGTGNFKGQILIESEKFKALSEETQSHISFDAQRLMEVIREQINMEWAKVNEVDDRSKHAEELSGLFKEAGFDPIHIEVINSEYCGEACCYKYPWIIATTNKGRIKLGWRKRVMNLDWSDSDLGINGMEMFKDEDVTKGTSYIHCWGKEKALEYLKKLNSKE